MNSLETDTAPLPGESLGRYVQRRRQELGLTQKAAATKAGIHPQSFGKLERQQTRQLNRKTKQGLAYALGVPEAYLEAACTGDTVGTSAGLQFCPQCWFPAPHPMRYGFTCKPATA